VSWAELVATSGMVSITYSIAIQWQTSQSSSTPGRERLLGSGSTNTRIGIWACSGNGRPPSGLLVSRSRHRVQVRGAVVRAHVRPRRVHRGGPGAPRRSDLRTRGRQESARRSADAIWPLHGRDGGQKKAMPGLNDTIDGFVAEALRLKPAAHPGEPHHGASRLRCRGRDRHLAGNREKDARVPPLHLGA